MKKMFKYLTLIVLTLLLTTACLPLFPNPYGGGDHGGGGIFQGGGGHH